MKSRLPLLIVAIAAIAVVSAACVSVRLKSAEPQLEEAPPVAQDEGATQDESAGEGEDGAEDEVGPEDSGTVEDGAGVVPVEETCTGGFIIGLASRPIPHGIEAGDPLPDSLLDVLRGHRWDPLDFEQIEIEPLRLVLRSSDPFAADPDVFGGHVEVVLVDGEELGGTQWVVVEALLSIHCDG
jgi:hypothetical protein